MNDVNKNNNKISKTFDINNKNEKEKESFYEKIKKKFFNFVFNDSDILVKLLYHKYFYNELYEEIQKMNFKNLSDIEFTSKIKEKIYINIKYPSKKLCEENLKLLNFNDFSDKKDPIDINVYEKDKFSKEFLLDYIKIYKFNWLNNFTNLCFFTCFGFYAFIFKINKRKKKLSNNLLLIVSIQIFLNGLSLYHTLKTHPKEKYLKQIYNQELQKYKLIFRE
jgi:hypothetical protein